MITASRQLAVSRARNDGSLDVVTASFENYDADREPAMRPSPFQAFVRVMMGCDKFCTYCIVPSVRGPEQSRPPVGDPGGSPAARRSGRQGNHPPGPDRQQLQVSGTGRAALPALRPARTNSRDRRHRADQVHHQFPQRHDRRPAPGRPRPPQGQPVPPRAGAERLRCDPQADETDVHGCVL